MLRESHTVLDLTVIRLLEDRATRRPRFKQDVRDGQYKCTAIKLLHRFNRRSLYTNNRVFFSNAPIIH